MTSQNIYLELCSLISVLKLACSPSRVTDPTCSDTTRCWPHLCLTDLPPPHSPQDLMSNQHHDYSRDIAALLGGRAFAHCSRWDEVELEIIIVGVSLPYVLGHFEKENN